MTGFAASLGTFLLLALTFKPSIWSGTWWATIFVAVCAGVVAAGLAARHKDES